MGLVFGRFASGKDKIIDRNEEEEEKEEEETFCKYNSSFRKRKKGCPTG
jgi:hypothetical protein